MGGQLRVRTVDAADEVEYWHWLIGTEFGVGNIEFYRRFADSGMLKAFCLVQRDADTGLFAYALTDYFGKKWLNEIIFYIRPECRGDLRLVYEYIKQAERIAREERCESIKIGANIGFKDMSLLRLLKRRGYADDTVSKELM
jgi:hypothetical protein